MRPPPVTQLSGLETLFDGSSGREIPLPADLASLYGSLRFPEHAGRPHVISNFVSTLDGVVTLGIPGHSGGGDISGFNRHDRIVMGLLRAVADAVVVGAGTLRGVPGHVWIAEYIYPALAASYQEVRRALGKQGPPLNVIVSAGGRLNPEEKVFSSGAVPVLVLTGSSGAALARRSLPASVEVRGPEEGTLLSAAEILKGIGLLPPRSIVLVEGGPRLMGFFFRERLLDELFLTLAPQVAGREDAAARPGLVAGTDLAPDDPRWGDLLSVKRAGDHLFLRYAFPFAEIR